MAGRGSILVLFLVSMACALGVGNAAFAGGRDRSAAPAQLSIHADFQWVVVDTWTDAVVGTSTESMDIDAFDTNPAAVDHSCGWPSRACFTDEIRIRRSGAVVRLRGSFEPRAAPFSGCADLVFDNPARSSLFVCDGGSPGKTPAGDRFAGTRISPTVDFVQNLSTSPRYRVRAYVVRGQIDLLHPGR